ncbi:MAG: hypothetical protein GC150_09005 [Rhizobiales bacterium]|nr:hypothetical protein [Hyphomicrobiales bacterium]
MFDFPGVTDLARRMTEDFGVVPYMVALFAVLAAIELFRRAPLAVAAKQLILIAASAGLIGYLDWRSLLIMTILATATYIASRLDLEFRKYIITVTAIGILGLILVKNVLASWQPQPIVLMGLSYYVFRLLSVVIEIGRKNPDYLHLKALPFFSYVYFFPIFFAGPVQKYADFRPVEVPDGLAMRTYGLMALIILIKLSLVDYLLLQAVIAPMRTDLVPVVLQWPAPERIGFFFTHGVVSFAYHYLDFMIYTEIAKGVGRLLGYHVVDNFNYPYLATSIADFWRRWHMSLTGFTRDYVFMPVMVRSRRVWLAMMLTMLVIGLWHTSNLNWLAWALLHGGALVAYDHFRRSRVHGAMTASAWRQRVTRVLGWATVILFVGGVNNLITFAPKYDVAWTFLRQALFGIE